MNPKKHSQFSIILLISLLLSLFTPSALAQEEEELRLNISKSFGYSSGFGSGNIKLQGVMKLTARGPETLGRVIFYLDETPLGEVSASPYTLSFNTDNYPLGVHTIYAVGYTADGRQLQSNQVKAEFVSAEAGWQDAMRIVGPLIALVFGIMAVAFVVPLLLERGKKSTVPLGTQQRYGLHGGSICPKCQRPFPLHLYGLNMLTHKLDRCPHCRRWSFVRPLPLHQLRAAEEAELAMAQEGAQISGMSDEEKLRKELEESRYDRL